MEPLERAIRKRGGVKYVAGQIGVSRAAVYLWINGRRQPSDKILSFLGLERNVSYVKTREWWLYELLEPDMQTVRYVGVTSQQSTARACAHRSAKKAVGQWMQEMAAMGKGVEIRYWKKFRSKDEALAAERERIQWHLKHGGHLLNIQHAKVIC